MTCSDPCQAVWIGPAAARVLAGAAPLRVHSTFPSTVNLEAVGTGAFVALCGPPGGIHPHAVALAQPGLFQGWRLIPGSPAGITSGVIHLQGEDGPQVVRLEQALRPAARPLGRVPRLGEAYLVCRDLLAAQAASAGDPGLAGLWHRPASRGQAAPLCQAALDLGAAAQAWLRGDAGPRLGQAVASLVGLGAGLTPAGDDCLCGFLAASRCVASGPGLPDALSAAMADNLDRTGSISAYLLRLGIEGFWPGPLLDLAEALGADLPAQAGAALGALCGIGHTSGRDLATGFLLGLACLGRGGGRECGQPCSQQGRRRRRIGLSVD